MVIETVLGTKGVPLFVFHVLRKRIVEGSAHELSASFLENEKKELSGRQRGSQSIKVCEVGED